MTNKINILQLNSRAHSNLAMLEFVARKLGSLKDSFVFLGGCATSLLITDTVAPDVRTTLDVDCIVDVLSLGQYHQLEQQLRALGFSQLIEEAVICRWRYQEIILDVMPTDERILGFSNRWYKVAIQSALTYSISEDLTIKSVSAPYFLATKFEAFKHRGNQDYLMSHDLEDIIAIIDGCLELMNAIQSSPLELKQYLANVFMQLLNEPRFISSLPGHLNYGSATIERANLVLDRIKHIISLGTTP